MKVIDSHTEGEPTRVILSGGPDLGEGPLGDRVERFRTGADHYRKFAINEPRGWDAMVGALLCEPTDSACAAGVIFFNNTGYLGMCGHGTIGVAATLYHLGKIGFGIHRIETPVGVVSVDLRDAHLATIENVPSYRFQQNVLVSVDGLGEIRGDIAWGGNWFFLVEDLPIPLVRERTDDLILAARRVRKALQDQGITGNHGAEIDHIEFGSATDRPGVGSVNFVLCPGGAYDRSPCGTGTSAKVACLAADGELKEQTPWVQESVFGGRFSAQFRHAGVSEDGFPCVSPSITGRAYVCGQTELIAEEGDPFGFDLQQAAKS